jgi:hypothetical protein
VRGSEFTSKTAALQGDSTEIAPTPNVKLWVLVTGDWWWWHATAFLEQLSPRKFDISEKDSSPSSLCACTSRLAARYPARVARCPRPRHDPPCLLCSGLFLKKTFTYTMELELELIKTQMAQKSMFQEEVYVCAFRASQNVKRADTIDSQPTG